MKTYIAVTGILFLLLTAAHVWRAVVERHLTQDPFFIATTIISTGMAVWALRLLRRGTST